MPTREQVLALVRERGWDYRVAARELAIPPGQAYLIATGMPADGSDGSAAGLGRPGAVEGSTQLLVHAEAAVVAPEVHEVVHAWIKARVASDPAMLARTAARDAVLGAPRERESPEREPREIASVVTGDHDRVTALFRQLAAIPGVTKGGSPVQQARRGSIVERIAAALWRHEATEEEQLWPVVAERLAEGGSLRAAGLAQEQAGKEVLGELTQLAPSEERFDELAEKAEELTRRHVAFEDRVLLALGAALRPDELEGLGRRFRRVADDRPGWPDPQAPGDPSAGAVGRPRSRRQGEAASEPEMARPGDAPSEE